MRGEKTDGDGAKRCALRPAGCVDELFGPVSSLIRAEDDEGVMRIANENRFGLGGGIFSEAKDRAIDLT